MVSLETGEHIKRDELVASIETDKITLPVNSPEEGVLVEMFAQPGDTVTVGADLYKLELGGPVAGTALFVIQLPFEGSHIFL